MSNEPVQPKQDYQGDVNLRTSSTGSAQPAAGGRSGGAAIVIGIVMLVAGIALSMAPTGRIFVGLIVVGIITIIRGIAAAAR